MEKIGIGILHYKRKDILKSCVNSITDKCSYDYLTIASDDRDNVGVAGNSNRLLKNLYNSGCDYIFLINDDVVALDNATEFYIENHKKTNINFLCFYKWPGTPKDKFIFHKMNGLKVREMYRITGNWIFLTRKVIDTIGYFDTNYGKFGEEHVDYTRRANFAGFFGNLKINIGNSLDIDGSDKYLNFQETISSVTDLNERKIYNQEASLHHSRKWSTGKQIKDLLFCPYKERKE